MQALCTITELTTLKIVLEQREEQSINREKEYRPASFPSRPRSQRHHQNGRSYSVTDPTERLQRHKDGLVVANIDLHTIVHSSNLVGDSHPQITYNLLGHLHRVENGELLIQLGFDLLLVVRNHLSDLVRKRSSRDASAQSRSNYVSSRKERRNYQDRTSKEQAQEQQQ